MLSASITKTEACTTLPQSTVICSDFTAMSIAIPNDTKFSVTFGAFSLLFWQCVSHLPMPVLDGPGHSSPVQGRPHVFPEDRTHHAEFIANLNEPAFLRGAIVMNVLDQNLQGQE